MSKLIPILVITLSIVTVLTTNIVLLSALLVSVLFLLVSNRRDKQDILLVFAQWCAFLSGAVIMAKAFDDLIFLVPGFIIFSAAVWMIWGASFHRIGFSKNS